MVKKNTKKWTPMKKLRIVFLFTAAFILCLLLAAGINDKTNMELRLMGIHNNNLVMLLEGSGKLCTYYKDISSPDSMLTKAENIAESGYTFFLDGGTLGIAECLESELDINLYLIDEKLKYDEYSLFEFTPSEGDKLAFANVGKNTYTMYILSTEGNLRSCEAMLEPEDTILLSGVSFLGSTQGGWIYAYADGVLRRWKGNAFDSCQEYPDVPCPEKLVGEDVYIDRNGLLIRIKDSVTETFNLDIGSVDPDACFGTDEYIIAADNSGTIHKFDWSGEDIQETGTAKAEGRILGIIEEYIVTEKDSQIYLEQLTFKEPNSGEETDPTPTPTPTPAPGESEEPTVSPSPDTGLDATPTPEPESTSTPDPDDGSSEPEEPTPTPLPSDKNDEVGKLIEEIQFKELIGDNGKYVAMLSGARVADLRKIYWPQSIEAFTQEDKPVFDSLLKTGMKIQIPLSDGNSEKISVIIRGDCDGDGRVRKSDITFASLYIVNAVYAETDVQFMAMDMNDDGKVTIWDLPMIADEIRRTE